MNRVKLFFSFVSFVIIGILVAAGMKVFDQSAPGSPMRSLLVNLLFPGLTAGFALGQRGEYRLVGYVACWIVNSALYWFLLKMLLLLVRKAVRRTTTGA